MGTCRHISFQRDEPALVFYSPDLVSQLELKYAENIWFNVTSNSTTKYPEFKTRFLDLIKKSESTRFIKLISVIDLGDLKASQLLKKLKSGNRCATS